MATVGGLREQHATIDRRPPLAARRGSASMREAGTPGATAQEMIERVQRGLDAERMVAEVLRELLNRAASFYLLHDLPFDRGDVDHVVIGPTGVFAIETKGHLGAVELAEGGLRINGYQPENEPLRQARRAAGRIGGYLRRFGRPVRRVQPVLCFVNASLLRAQIVDDVLVTRPGPLCYLISHWDRLDAILPTDCQQIFRTLARRLPRRAPNDQLCTNVGVSCI
jgi:hypothetical protein